MKKGDLVRRVHYSAAAYTRDKELFMVISITGEFHGQRDKTHEMTLGLWEVTEPTGHVSHLPMNVFEVV